MLDDQQKVCEELKIMAENIWEFQTLVQSRICYVNDPFSHNMLGQI